MLKSKKVRVIAIDGPASSGKSTTARLVAGRLGYLYLDTGAMYRAITLKALRAGVDLDDEKALEKLARDSTLRMSFENEVPRVFLNGEDVTSQIRSPEVSDSVSKVSAYPGVRGAMVALQREFAKEGGIVAEGRDIGTVVFPGAEVKIFLTCDLKERTKRRYLELESQGISRSPDEIRENLSKRDEIDSNRESSPLLEAEEAVVVDTTNLTIEEQVEEVLRRLNSDSEVT
ncbi:MAG: (d)CMP kinase [Candidatus Zixiibacteriota bacterium]